MRMLNKINGVLRKIGIPLNVLNILIGLVMGIAYVYLPFTSIFGLVLGIIMAVSGSATIGISYFFTSKNTKSNKEQKSDGGNEKEASLKNTKASNLFLAFAIPMILLNSAACFFGMYTGIILLAAALATPLAPAAIVIIAVVLATTLAAGTLINSWLQTHNIWQSLKKPEPIREAGSNEEPKQIAKKKEYEIPLFRRTRNFEKSSPSSEKKSSHKISQCVGSLFRKCIKHNKPSPVMERRGRDKEPLLLFEKRTRSSSAPPRLERPTLYRRKA